MDNQEKKIQYGSIPASYLFDFQSCSNNVSRRGSSQDSNVLGNDVIYLNMLKKHVGSSNTVNLQFQ